MLWFFIALLNPILHAGVNHFDKYLLSKYFKNVQVGSLVIFSGIFSLVLIPVVLLFSHGSVATSFPNALILALNGSLVVIATMFYLYALDEDEASFVVPLFQAIPIFGLMLSFLFLGEVIHMQKIIGALVILSGSAILSFDIGGEKVRFKKKVVLFMLLSCLCYSFNIIIFKSIALSNGFWQSIFWDLTGKITFVSLLLACIPVYRRSFVYVFTTYKFRFVFLNGLNDLLSICGDWAQSFAVLFAPIFLVQMVSTVQPVFVFIFGIIITTFLSKVGSEVLERKILLQKLVGIGMVICGALLFL